MNARRPAPIEPVLSCLDRRPGHEVVFEEIVNSRTTDAPGLMREASRLHSASAAPGIDQPAWTSLSVGTVRTWVAVAKEARAIHVGVRAYVREAARP